MGIRVQFYEDVGLCWAAAEEFLRSRAVIHNLTLSILDGRMTQPEPGRYWVASREGQVVGVALQSPLVYPATVVPMGPEVVAAVVDAIVDAGMSLPGVNGEAATTASFAGRWTERMKSGAFPVQGLRLYELGELQPGAAVAGELRKANGAERDLAVAWMHAFSAETQTTPASNAEKTIDTALEAERLWVWDDGSVVSVVIGGKPMADVVRVSFVYTPPEFRGRGYAGACVHELSRRMTSAGYRCILYTDLGNPTSNAIYRRIGYRAVMEGMQYRFA
jgi:RimJ/RimL family protein N-acetyltransferase